MVGFRGLGLGFGRLWGLILGWRVNSVAYGLVVQIMVYRCP